MACTQQMVLTASAAQPQNNLFFDRLAGQLALQGVAVGYYYDPEGPLQSAMHQLKYQRNPPLAYEMGQRLAAAIRDSAFVAQLPAHGVCCPVPMHWWRQWLRGYNQAAILARGVADGLGMAMQPQLLRRRRYTRSQVGKSREQRHQNVQNAFVLAAPAPPAVVLIDDVLTTGATLASAARTLLAAGSQVWLLALASPREQH